jgi:hypothetical protein
MSSSLRRALVAAALIIPGVAHAQSAAPPPAQGAPTPAPQPAPAPPPAAAYPPGYGPPPGYGYPQTPPPAYGYPPPAYAYPPPAVYAYPVPVPYPVTQTPPPRPPRTIRRDGFTFGAALGWGNIWADRCTTCGNGMGMDIHAGVMVHHRVALLADLSWVYRRYDVAGFSGRVAELSNIVIAGAAQVWLLNRVWVRGGVGSGTISYTDWTGTDDSASAIGYVYGAGLEILQGATFAIDLQYAGAYGAYRGGAAANNAFVIGMNWY